MENGHPFKTKLGWFILAASTAYASGVLVVIGIVIVVIGLLSGHIVYAGR